MKAYYLELVAKIRTVTEFAAPAWVKLWNNQLQHIKEEKGFRLPALFVEFVNDITKQRVGAGQVIYNPVQITLHLIFDRRQVEDLTHFDIKDKINAALENFMPVSIPAAAALVGTAERIDDQHTNIIDYQLDFVTRFPAQAKTDARVQVTAQLELNADLQIDNQIIRGGILP